MFEVTPRFFKHYQVVKCATKLLSHLLETCLSTRNTLVKREKRSVTFPDFFYRYKDKTSLTFPAEKEEDGNSYKNQEQDTTNNSTYYRTGI